MSSYKVLALSALAAMATGTLTHAAPFSWRGESWNRDPWSRSGEVSNASAADGPDGLDGVSRGFDPRSDAGHFRIPNPYDSPTPVAPTAVTPIDVLPRSAPASTPIQVATPAPSAPSASSTPDAFINFGNGPYLESGALTTGSIQPWYDSPAVQKVFGGVPNAQQQADFTRSVLQDIEATYKLSGLDPKLTLDPTAGAAHTLSVVSGASGPSPNVIGITDVGHDGFGFIDKLANATTPDQLAWAVAHTVSHELMHAFGVAVHEDQTGRYLDAATEDWSLLTNPDATFSPAAVGDILAAGGVPSSGTAAEVLALSSVPEPGSVSLWGLGTVAAAYRWKRMRRGTT